MHLLCFFRTLIVMLSLFTAHLSAMPVSEKFPKQYSDCVSCHQAESQGWLQSDHANAMALPSQETVKGNFKRQSVEHYGQKALFFIDNGQYKVTVSYDERVDTYPIKYTFGHFPLQQYLVETEPGKLQVLPFAWDARNKTNGGQRWYHNYSHEEIRPKDRLHWRQPLQNWNGMCADCHSDGLVRNYDVDNDRFSSEFDNINVGCLSCHGDMSEHVQQSKIANLAKANTSSQHSTGQWLRGVGDKTAHWQGEARDNDFMDNCFACHSLRAPLTDGIKANTAFLDQFMPNLLAAPLYHADGQIKEEDYVYGSFLQSKMFAAGVNCLDCHDQHTMKVKIEGNGLCLQCHGAEVYQVKSHHQHEESSTGAQCVNCHMPTTRYMGVDDRRDHSFKIPRPDISAKFNTPNACTSCHQDKPNTWASEQLVKWHGPPKAIPSSKQLLMALNSNQTITLDDHLSIIADHKLDVISRATALSLLAYSTRTLTGETLKPYLMHEEALIRLSAANVATLLSPADKTALVVPLLTDKYKAVRVAAARSLVDSKISAVEQNTFIVAFNELQLTNDISSWRGEGRMNKGISALQSGDLISAEKAFKATIAIEPYFDSGYINLADLYRSLQKPAQVSSVLMKGMKNLPKSDALHYSYGLHLVRQKSLVKAVEYFSKAMLLSPENTQYAYTYVLAMDGAGQSVQALNKLKSLILTYADKSQLRDLGLYLAQKLNNRESYDYFRRL